MKRGLENSVFIGLLLASAALAWLRNTSWIQQSWDTLAIIVALPLCWYMGAPWKAVKKAHSSTAFVVLGVALYLLGLLSDTIVFMALGWTLCLGNVLSRITFSTRYPMVQLLTLPAMAFPWVVLDGEVVGWYFRLSGAWVTSQVFSFLDYPVVQMGSFISIQEVLVDVAEACAGLNLLQSLFIAGSALALIFLGGHPRFWLGVALLPAVAWISNTLRILTIAAVGLGLGVDVATGLFHSWGGLFVIVVMFLLCAALFNALTPKRPLSKTQ